jgi:very-short-patch-repair endonuclease
MREIYSLAAMQHGVISRGQLSAAGFGRSAVHRRVEAGYFFRLDHGVYAVASSSPTWERQLMAALMSRTEAVVGNTSAGYLLGLKNCHPGQPVIVVPKSSNVRSRLARIIESDQFDKLATTGVRGFRVTTVPETLLSLAADLAPDELGSSFDHALLTGRLDLDAMKIVFDREVGRRPRGIKALRALTAHALPTAPSLGSSFLEGLLEKMIRSLPVAGWTREYLFALGDRPARADLFIPDWALVVEADGRNWHMRRADFEHDRRRDNELATRGIQVLRYTYRMLTEEHDRCRAELLAVGNVRSARRSA